jgi:hypothetical protein
MYATTSYTDCDRISMLANNSAAVTVTTTRQVYTYDLYERQRK